MRRNWKRSKSTVAVNRKRKRKSSSRRESHRSTSSSSSQSKEIRDALAKKRTEFIEKTTAELGVLVSRHARLQEKFTALGDKRMHILPRRILQTQMNDLTRQITDIQSGKSLANFDEKLASFKRVQRMIERRVGRNAPSSSVKRTKKRPSLRPSPGNRRKSAAHNRDIRVSSSKNIDKSATFEVLMDEIEDEFKAALQSDGDDRAPPPVPVLYFCNRNYCPDCETVLMQKLPSESALACPECGVSTSYLDATAASTGHSDDRSFNQFSYSRSNHFLQWLRACQGKESVTVPEDILKGVCHELSKRRVRPQEVTSRKVRECLKTMRKRKYYEHVVLITSLLSGQTPPRFSPQVERTLQRLFQRIQRPFTIAVAALCPERKNFLSYSYILTKLCGLLRDSIDERWLTAWPSLKGKDKIYRSDKLWAHMCRQLGWKFYPSI